MIKNVTIHRNLSVDSRFYEFLNVYRSRVSYMILGIESLDDINFISIHNSEMVSVLPKSKYKNLSYDTDPYSDGIGRVNIRIGRLLSKLFPKEVISQFLNSISEVENFVNLYKAHFDDSNVEFKIVDGEEIIKWYHEDNYLRPGGNIFGTLWNSCMRYEKRLKFLNLYSINPQFKMLVMLQKDQHGQIKLRARALLVEAQTIDDDYLPEGTKVHVMDRIYTIYDSDVNIFKKWAKDNGYLHKFEQTSRSKCFFGVNDQDNKFISLVVKLSYPHITYYPYLDTFSYFRWNKGELYNNSDIRHDYTLVQATGGLEPERESEEEEMFEED